MRQTELRQKKDNSKAGIAYPITKKANTTKEIKSRREKTQRHRRIYKRKNLKSRSIPDIASVSHQYIDHTNKLYVFIKINKHN